MAVATAMTAERRPMCLSIACRTMVVALASRSGVIGMVACGPLTAAGRSRWFGASPAAHGPPGVHRLGAGDVAGGCNGHARGRAGRCGARGARVGYTAERERGAQENDADRAVGAQGAG